MNLPKYSLNHRPVILAFISILMIAGLMNFANMPRREDPEITIREALILTQWPGTSTKRIEELITIPIEKIVVEIPEIMIVESKSMPGFSVVEVTAEDDVKDIDQVWDDLRAKVSAIRTLPSGVKPLVNSDFGDVFEIVYAVHQKGSASRDYSPRELEIIAETIEDEIETLPTVAKVEFWGVQEERIYVEFNSADAAKFNLTFQSLKDLFEAHNIVLPGGELDTEKVRYSITPTGEFRSVDEIQHMVIARGRSGAPIELGSLPIEISRRYVEPTPELTRITSPGRPHIPTVMLGISMKSGQNVERMNASVVETIERLTIGSIPKDIAVTRVNDLPRQVMVRISDFQVNLMQGVLIVLLIAFLMMGWRPAIVMATAVPVSMIGAFAVVPLFGIELEQFSIASLIISLGMVVDNAIVVSDNAVRLMKEGETKLKAIEKGAHELAIPMLTSTLTTVAAFLPMLTIVGNAGEYIASLPIVITITLVISYIVAMLLTPIICAWMLVGATDGKGSGSGWITPLLQKYDGGIQFCLTRPGKIVAVAGLAFLASLTILPIIGSQFFPSGERDQFFVKIWLPENAPIAKTSEVVREVEAKLLELSPHPISGVERLKEAVTFVGSGGPRLMLTQAPDYNYPYYALILINTTDGAFTAGYAEDIRKEVQDHMLARVSVKEFMLGPPINNPIELRVSGPDHETLARIGDKMVRAFKETPGTVRPFDNWGAPAGHVSIDIDTHAANLAGVTNAEIALTTRMILSGAELSQFREQDHLVPIIMRTLREERRDITDLSDIYVGGREGKVPLNSIATVKVNSHPAVIARRNGIPTITIASDIKTGLLSNSVVSDVREKIDPILDELTGAYFIEEGGELEETVKTQNQVIRAVFLSIIIMILVLTVQYNSLLKPAVILFAIPMGMIGVLFGLLITGWAMGFMAMLGLLSLGGIVINNAIILVDFIEGNIASGQSLKTSVANAGRARMQPILLTSLTTIGGLLPLSLFGGPLWAPMTNGMIFGLIISTVLTLFVIPSLYVVFVEKLKMQVD